MKDRTPKKKPSNRRKKSEKFNPKEDKEAYELTQESLNAFLKQQLKSRTGAQNNINALASVIEEFLNCYIILGYSFDSTPVSIISAHNQQEADSLTTLINKFLTIDRNNSIDDE
jgi:hypothetical protein